MKESKLLYMREPRQATWLELFFDLIFVVALGKLTHLLAHTHHGHLDDHVWLHLILTFIPMWWIWVGHTVYSNRFDADTRPHRVATLLLMFLMMLASVQIGAIDENPLPFVAAYCTARLFIVGLYFAAARKYPEKADFARRTGFTFLVGAAISGGAVLLPSPATIAVFYAGILFDMVGRKFIVRNAIPIDRDHLVERVGLLAIILLGESVISLTGGLTDVSWDPITTAAAASGFLLICMIWWIYFDSFPLLIESRRDVEGDAILYSQLSTYISFAILANMIRHGILGGLAMDDFRVMVLAGTALFYFGKQTAYFVNIPKYRFYILLNTSVMLTLVGASLLFETQPFMLFGVCFSMMVYIFMNYWAQIRLYGRVNL